MLLHVPPCSAMAYHSQCTLYIGKEHTHEISQKQSMYEPVPIHLQVFPHHEYCVMIKHLHAELKSRVRKLFKKCVTLSRQLHTKQLHYTLNIA